MPGVFSNNELRPDPSLCSVMMPFASNFDAIYRLIQRCCKDQNLTCIRADEDSSPGKITDKIFDLISGSGIIIVDMTGRNANVFYELGIAHSVSNNVVLLTQSVDDVPFDLQNFLCIPYSNSVDGAEKLATDLSKMLSTIMSSADFQIPPDDERRRSQAIEVDQLPTENIDLGLVHLQAEIARKNGDMKQAAEWIQKAIEGAKIGEGDAPEVGNCAIEAELCGLYDFAEVLYELAITRDLMHINNRQSYVSFLLDHRSGNSEKLELAKKMLSELEDTAERKERTRGLKAQYLAVMQKRMGKAIDLNAIAEVVGDGQFATIQQAAPALILLQQAGQYTQMCALIDGLRDKLPDKEVVNLDRILADAYAGSGDEQLRREAITKYEKLLDANYLHSKDVMHNLATLLYASGGDGAKLRACELWTEVYADRPTSPKIRKAFAQFLVNNGREQDAAKVLAGNPIT